MEKRLKRVADEARKTNTKPSRAFTGWLREEKRDGRRMTRPRFGAVRRHRRLRLRRRQHHPHEGTPEPERGERQSVVCRPGGGVFLRFTRSRLVGTPIIRVLLDGTRRVSDDPRRRVRDIESELRRDSKRKRENYCR